MGATITLNPTTFTSLQQPGTLLFRGAAPIPSSVDSEGTPSHQDLGSPSDLLTPLSTLLQTRHSVRAFLPTPVPPELLHTALSLAQHSASNSNIQNWRLYLVSGPALTRLTTALMTAASESSPKIPPLPPKFSHYRSDLGHKVYGEGYHIARSDIAGKIEKERRNYKFFDAPVGGIVCMDKELAKHDALSVGMWLQSLELGLLAQGLRCCVQVSTAGYAGIVKEVLGIREELEVICGVAIGFEDSGARINEVRSGRSNWRDCVVEMQ